MSELVEQQGRGASCKRRAVKRAARTKSERSASRGRGRAPRLIRGDCLDALRSIPDSTVDAVVTDPPYGIRYVTRRGHKVANDERPFIWWLHDAWRVTREGGALLCFCRWDVQEQFRSAIETAGWKLKSQVIWDRELHGMGDVRAAFAPSHDVIWFAVKGKYRFPGSRPRSVIRARRVVTGLVHPTEKPVQLMEELLAAVAPSGGLVLDPCMGSGTTGVACKKLGLKFIGIELDDSHYGTAKSRIMG